MKKPTSFLMAIAFSEQLPRPSCPKNTNLKNDSSKYQLISGTKSDMEFTDNLKTNSIR